MTDNVFSQLQISSILNLWLGQEPPSLLWKPVRLQRSDLLQQGALATHSGL